MRSQMWLTPDEGLAAGRRFIEDFLTRHEVDEDFLDDCVIAAGEAIANALTHGAVCQESGGISIAVAREPSAVAIRVADCGTFTKPEGKRSPYRGLQVMEAAVDEVAIDTRPGKTELLLRKRLAA